MTVVRFEPDAHAEVQSLLAWYVKGSLDDDDRALVDGHLAQCPRCQAELEVERAVQAAHAGLDSPSADVGQGLAMMRARLASGAPARRAASPSSWWRPDQWVHAWHWALAAQFAVAIALTALLWTLRTTEPAFHALGAAAQSKAANAVVMFLPTATEAQIRSALRTSDARLVDGPTVTNAYLIRLPGHGHAEAIDRLRAQPGVSMAESLDNGMKP